MKLTSKIGLAYAVALAALIAGSLTVGWLVAPLLEKGREECVARCKLQGRAGSIQGVQITSPQKPGRYMTENRCICN